MKRYLFSLLLVAFLAGCSSLDVKTDFDPHYDFSAASSYRWASESELHPNDVLKSNTLVKKRLMASVDKAMAAKGLVKTADADADLVIVMHAGVKEKMQVHEVPNPQPHLYPRRGYYPGWYDPWWGIHDTTTHVSYYDEGTLVIDLVAPAKKELVWRGVGVKPVKSYKDQSKQQEAFDKIVAEILADYPPGAQP
ncbi:MAG: DUF4136 domain-containing protein [Candidatus Pelagadaptatus aseana]|uniref:DUF4136 domain-containing protein n=1 Tax=Candidatus Pelagadaptatus aseana TaxID=3120508 RepID=UPI0039B2BE77